MKHYPFYTFFLLLAALAGCTHKDVDSVDLEEFHTRYVNRSIKDVPFNDSVDVFIDYSSGMYEAMYTSLNSVVNEVLNTAKSSKTKFYRAGATTPFVIDIEAKENIPTTTANYTEKRSQLDKPIEMIVAKNKQAVFITDFELVPTGEKIFEGETAGGRVKTWINPDAWAVELFETWLAKGHRIDIFASKFMRSGGQPQFLYILVFTPKEAVGKENALLTRLAGLDKKLSRDLYHFSFHALTDVKLVQRNYNADNGGLHESLAPLDYANVPGKNFEYYRLKFEDVDKYLLNEPAEKDKRMLKKLFLEGETSGFSEVQLGVDVYDITETYSHFQQVKDQAPPEYDVDPETGDSTLVSAPSMGYKFVEGTNALDVFDMVYNKNSKEVGLKLNQNYYGPENKVQLFRAEVVIDKAGFAPTPDMQKVLQWRDPQGFMVRSLYESVTEAMKRAETTVKGRMLHTYYIEFVK